ncbi:AprI/Inh family metalloprotease inhibitor [Devosia sp. BSSL-BM10]|uniref:AprI/Inh family metalloprotease inhibitor n=1 Tax=Devosia litorisediminis TaxID=2829817 RepID=A0A942I4H8_9HYPH|nr:AprI/Inh family metalloprotease inhibitor [Devosia litorisediminis]MBS3847341.1 AprI/Inh family metalloprotease inhibitor [Devosia litorisediminis]
MSIWMRGSFSAAGVAAIALLVAGCTSTGSNTANLNTIGAPQQLQPVQNSTVQQGTLPAIGATGTVAPGLSGQPVLGGVQANTQVAATTTGTPSSIVSLDPLARPVSGAMTTGPEGVWNVVAGAQQCRLNLPMTAKTGTSYFRASAPGCAIPTLAGVAGWQQVGSQLQLYDENGNIAAFLAPSGGRYIGTMGGGQAISMAR